LIIDKHGKQYSNRKIDKRFDAWSWYIQNLKIIKRRRWGRKELKGDLCRWAVYWTDNIQTTQLLVLQGFQKEWRIQLFPTKNDSSN
jgi:hypothetical protein